MWPLEGRGGLVFFIGPIVEEIITQLIDVMIFMVTLGESI